MRVCQNNFSRNQRQSTLFSESPQQSAGILYGTECMEVDLQGLWQKAESQNVLKNRPTSQNHRGRKNLARTAPKRPKLRETLHVARELLAERAPAEWSETLLKVVRTVSGPRWAGRCFVGRGNVYFPFVIS